MVIGMKTKDKEYEELLKKHPEMKKVYGSFRRILPEWYAELKEKKK